MRRVASSGGGQYFSRTIYPHLSDAGPRSIDLSVRLVRRYDQALPRRPERGLALFCHAYRTCVNRMVPCMVTKRPVPCICLGRLHHPGLEAHHGSRVGMCAGVTGPRPHCVLDYMGDRKTGRNARRLRVPRLDRFDRKRRQNQRLGIRGESLWRRTVCLRRGF